MAQRLGMIAEWRLAGRELPKIKLKPKASFRLVSMGGKNHLSLLRESLHSFARNASEIPPLTIISDGSLEPTDFNESLSFWPGSIQVMMPEEVMEPLDLSIRDPLKLLVASNPLGLKLSAIIALSARGSMLFMDLDILWFSDMIPLLKNEIEKYQIATALEENSNVNMNLAQKYAPELLSIPSVNTGCVITNCDISTLEPLKEVLLYVQNSSDLENRINEQTIIGILATRNGGFLDSKLLLTHFNDAFFINNRRPWKEGYHARHYVAFMRHQFYRDAILIKQTQ